MPPPLGLFDAVAQEDDASVQGLLRALALMESLTFLCPANQSAVADLGRVGSSSAPALGTLLSVAFVGAWRLHTSGNACAPWSTSAALARCLCRCSCPHLLLLVLLLLVHSAVTDVFMSTLRVLINVTHENTLACKVVAETSVALPKALRSEGSGGNVSAASASRAATPAGASSTSSASLTLEQRLCDVLCDTPSSLTGLECAARLVVAFRMTDGSSEGRHGDCSGGAAGDSSSVRGRASGRASGGGGGGGDAPRSRGHVDNVAPLGAAARFDVLVTCSGLLTNLLEHSFENRDVLSRITLPVRPALGSAVGGPPRVPAIRVLVSMFASSFGRMGVDASRWRWNSGDGDAATGSPDRPVADEAAGGRESELADGVAVEDVFACAYLALMIGCSIRAHTGLQECVRDGLPKRSFAALGLVLSTFLRLQVRFDARRRFILRVSLAECHVV
jgi:hypothetical protein